MLTQPSKTALGTQLLTTQEAPRSKSFWMERWKQYVFQTCNSINWLKRGLKSKEWHITPAPWCAHYLTHAHNHITRPGIRWLALDNMEWCRTEGKSCFPMSMTSSSSSRDRNKYGGIWFMLQTIRIESLEEVDRASPYSAIFVSVTRERRWRERHWKARFSISSTSPFVI